MKVPLAFPIQWVKQPFKYLGIWLTPDKNEVVTANYGTALTQLEEKANRWLKLPLSLMGRISIMKMVIMPKLLYLFLNIPIRPPLLFFNRLKSLLLQFAWAGGTPCLAWSVLTLPLHQGGLAAPAPELYYHCAQAHFAAYWLTPAVHDAYNA